MIDKNIFQELVRFIRSFEELEQITRKEIIEAVDKVIQLPRYDDKIEAATLDVYRRYLTGAGYLESKSRGVYIYVAEIPRDLTLSQLKKEYNANIKRI